MFNHGHLFYASHELSDDPFELLSPVLQDRKIVDFVWRYINPAGAAMFDRTAEAMIGQHLLADPPDPFRSARCRHWIAVMNDSAPRNAEFRRVEGGSVRWYQTRAVSLGKHLAASTIDATAQVRALEDECTARRQLEQAAYTKDQFLAKLNHELRTPLNAISGWAHLAGRLDADPALIQRATETISRNAQAQAAIVDSLLDLNRIAGGTLTFAHESCDLSAILHRAIASVERPGQARWTKIHSERVEPGLSCLGDAERLQQAFGDLLSNAIRHTPLGGDVHVSGLLDADRLCVEIRDCGDGIAPELLPTVFDLFSQGDPEVARHHGGLGLGLTIVRSIIELHGGKIAITSEGAGLGTTVRVELPSRAAPTLAFAAAAKPAAGTEPAAKQQPGASESASGSGSGSGSRPAIPSSGAQVPVTPPVRPVGRRFLDASDGSSLAWRRVLVVEDQIDSLDVIAALLRQQGAIVRAFETAEHALAAAENGSFDLVISDLGMPGMDGMEFIQRLKRHPRPVKAIALTAYADDKNRAQAVAAGFSRVMIKPIAPAHFLAAVRAELEDIPQR